MTDPKTKQAMLKMREDGASYAEIADFFLDLWVDEG